jgi:prolipoprotein diacylglyceryl transferase
LNDNPQGFLGIFFAMTPIIWNPDPILFHIGTFTIKWYGLFFTLGTFFGLFAMIYIFEKEKADPSKVINLFYYTFIGAIVGARLGHCLFYDPSYYLSHPLQILHLFEGGLASHGGVVGVLLAWYIFARRHNYRYLNLIDKMSITSMISIPFARLGNLFNSEIIGKPTDLPWAFVFQRVDNIPRHPVQLYEFVAYITLFIVAILVFDKYRDRLKDGLMTGFVFLTSSSMRFLLEFFKTQQETYDLGIILNTGQLLSIPFIVVGVWLMWRGLKKIET